MIFKFSIHTALSSAFVVAATTIAAATAAKADGKSKGDNVPHFFANDKIVDVHNLGDTGGEEGPVQTLSRSKEAPMIIENPHTHTGILRNSFSPDRMKGNGLTPSINDPLFNKNLAATYHSNEDVHDENIEQPLQFHLTKTIHSDPSGPKDGYNEIKTDPAIDAAVFDASKELGILDIDPTRKLQVSTPPPVLCEDQPLIKADVTFSTLVESCLYVTDYYNFPVGNCPYDDSIALGCWNTTQVTNMRRAFFKAFRFNQDITSWDTSSVTDMSSMFEDAKAFNQAIGSWDVSAVKDMEQMFDDAESFIQPLDSWNVTSVDDMDKMFYNAKSFNLCLSTWGVKTLSVSASKMFEGSGCPPGYNPSPGNDLGPWCQGTDQKCSIDDYIGTPYTPYTPYINTPGNDNIDIPSKFPTTKGKGDKKGKKAKRGKKSKNDKRSKKSKKKTDGEMKDDYIDTPIKFPTAKGKRDNESKRNTKKTKDKRSEKIKRSSDEKMKVDYNEIPSKFPTTKGTGDKKGKNAKRGKKSKKDKRSKKIKRSSDDEMKDDYNGNEVLADECIDERSKLPRKNCKEDKEVKKKKKKKKKKRKKILSNSVDQNLEMSNIDECINNAVRFRLKNGRRDKKNKSISCEEVLLLPAVEQLEKCKTKVIAENCPGICDKEKCPCTDVSGLFLHNGKLISCDKVTQTFPLDNRIKLCKSKMKIAINCRGSCNPTRCAISESIHDPWEPRPLLVDDTPGYDSIEDQQEPRPLLVDDTPGYESIEDQREPRPLLVDDTPGYESIEDQREPRPLLVDDTPGYESIDDQREPRSAIDCSDDPCLYI